MRRRSRRAPNTSESTGKIGQEIPTDQLAPLVPLYPDEPGARAAEPGARAAEPHTAQHIGEHRAQAHARPPKPQTPARQEWNEAAGSGRFELETQPEIPSVPPPEPEAAGRSPQAPKGYVVLAIGLPGSGKTTWFRRRGVTPLSRARLIARMPWNYVDATNLSIHERRQWIKMAKSFGYEVQAVFFDVPLEVCLQRNSQRDRSVSEDIMRKMGEKLKPPVFEEGFEKITVVRVKSAG
jgi:hypothetical protein